MKINLEIACRNSEEYGYETNHWSLNQLVNVVIREGIVKSIPAKTISRFFKYGENPPTSRPLLAAFFRKTESPETFAEKVNEICSIYHDAETTHEAGDHTVSVDEMTGIQALEYKYPDKPAYIEFEYIRYGTTSLIGFFDVATGRVEQPYLNSAARKRTL